MITRFEKHLKYDQYFPLYMIGNPKNPPGFFKLFDILI